MLRLLVTFMLLFNPTVIFATTKTIEIEFSFTPPADRTVASYNLYQDDNLACNATEDNQGVLACNVDAEFGIVYSWQLAAVYDDLSISNWSPSFPFSLVDSGSDASTVGGSVAVPDGQVCINYSLTNLDENTTWSSVEIAGNVSRIALYGVLNNEAKTLDWDDPSSRQLCWPGVFPGLGVIQVQLAAYRGGVWLPGTSYQLGDEVTGELDGYYYTVATGGVSGSSAPFWPIVIGEQAVDNGVRWDCHAGANTWKSKKQMRLVYLKEGETIKKSSTNRAAGRFGFRTN